MKKKILPFGLVALAGFAASCGSKSSSDSSEPTPEATPAATSTATGTGTGAKTGQAKPLYVPKNVPAAIAPTLPSSVGNKKTTLKLTNAETSHGYSELNEQLLTMKNDMNETVLYLLLGDAVYDEALAKCGGAMPCTAKDLKAKVSQEIVNLVKSLTDASFDEYELTEAELDKIKVGDEFPIESLTISENIRFGTQTYAKCLKFGGQEKDENNKPLTNWTSEICFDAARTKVYVHDLESGKLPDETDATKKVTFDSKYSATFNLESGVFQSKSSMKYGKSKFATDLMIDSQSDKELEVVKAPLSEADKKAYKDKEPIFVVANIAGDEPDSGGPYGVKVEGFMDNDGGVVKSAYTLSTIKITAAKFSAQVESDAFYLIVPGSATDTQLKTAAFEVAVGSLLTDASEGDLDFTKDELDYWGPTPVPAGVFKLIKVTANDDGEQVLTTTAITLTSIASTTSQDTDWYHEAFDAKGNLTGSCSQEDEGGAWVCEKEEIVKEALKKLPDGGIKVPGSLVVTFGSTLTGTVLSGHDFVVLVGTKDVSAISPADVSKYADDVLVFGSFHGNPDAKKAAFKEDYKVVVYPGSVKDDFNGAKIYTIEYNSATGAPSFKLLTGHDISVTVL